MFDQFKMLGALAGLMKDRDKVKAAGERVRATLAASSVSGEGGGGAVRVVVTGAMRVRSVHLEPALAAGMAQDPATRDAGERLLVDAMNQALEKAQALVQKTLADEARALGLPEELAGPLAGALGGR